MRLFFGYEDGDLDWDTLTKEEVELVILKWEGIEIGSPNPAKLPHTIKVD